MREVASFFRVLADEARLSMLWLLFNHRELCVCDFIEVLGITQSKASRHLRILYSAGIVSDRRDGLWVYYRLRSFRSGMMKSHLDELRTHLAKRPEAERLLKQLSDWLRHKQADVRCMRQHSSRPDENLKAAISSALHGGPR